MHSLPLVSTSQRSKRYGSPFSLSLSKNILPVANCASKEARRVLYRSALLAFIPFLVSMGDRQALVPPALLPHALRPVIHRQLRPIVVAALQAIPIFPWLVVPRRDHLVQRSHIQDHPIVDVRGIAPIGDGLQPAGELLQVEQQGFQVLSFF